jgi:phosphatidylethanolamine-binding protein (PEBP) family uncharacterized protein
MKDRGKRAVQTKSGFAFPLSRGIGLYGYIGAAPPVGHGPHRYLFAVHALKVATLPINHEVTPAICGFNMFGNTLGRACLTPIYEQT